MSRVRVKVRTTIAMKCGWQPLHGMLFQDAGPQAAFLKPSPTLPDRNCPRVQGFKENQSTAVGSTEPSPPLATAWRQLRKLRNRKPELVRTAGGDAGLQRLDNSRISSFLHRE
jgi:hypothetical protein